jgi:hypothetical protein
MIHITMGSERPPTEQDPLGRDRVGFSETMSPGALYDANHGCWVIGTNHRNERYVLFSYRGIVRQAVEIQRIKVVKVREPGDTRDDRCVIDGTILEAGHPVYDTYVGQQQPVERHRNPVRYFNSPLDTQHACLCGCGGAVAGRDFLSGHDQTALHQRVAKIGTVTDFIAWFDALTAPLAATGRGDKSLS